MKANFEQKWSKASRTKKKKMLLSVWSSIIHVRDKVCQYCGKAQNTNAHHIFTVGRKSTALNLSNGILLCSGHHTLNSDFSAHKTPRAFFRWLEIERGTDWVNTLEQLSNTIHKPDYESEKIALLSQCEKYGIDIEQIKIN